VKIRRFVAKDMRTALDQIKHELGADAVIMSNKKIPEGVELMAAVDYQQKIPSDSTSAAEDTNNETLKNDVVSLSSAPRTQQPQQNDEKPVDSLSALLGRKIQQHNASNNEPDIEQQFKNFTDKLEQASLAQPDSSSTLQQATVGEQPPQMPTKNVLNTQTISANDELEQMRAEMASIRSLLEHQVSGLMWQDYAQRDPNRAVLVNRLMAMGLTEQVSDHVANCTPTHENEEVVWGNAKKLLVNQLSTSNNEIIRRGGIVSLVGPTGVGKTTTIAKLAARFAQINGSDSVVMISTDSYRIAGYEQLSTFAKIIGCKVAMAQDPESLDALLTQYSDKKLVLIDTAGMGQRDMRLAEHLTTLIANSRVRIRNYLVLAANTQQRVMQENVERFKKIPLAGCIYTKLDESLSIGEIIATSIQNGLPIGYLTDGQRVPEDIKVANAEKLVTLADKLATKLNGQFTWRPMPQGHSAMM
jgi:flagellar biosynthesis protein FlhF